MFVATRFFARLDVVLRHLPALKKGIRKIAMPAGVFNHGMPVECCVSLHCLVGRV